MTTTITTRPTYVAEVSRSGKWWAIEVPQVPGCFSQARRTYEIEPMVRDAIALMVEAPPDSFDVVVHLPASSAGTVAS